MYTQILKANPYHGKDGKFSSKDKAGVSGGPSKRAPTDPIPRTPTQEKSHQKALESENWHTRTMAQFKDRDAASLNFVRQDAADAIKAMPDNPKAGQYMDEIHYASMELKARANYRAAKTKKSGLSTALGL